MLDKIKTLRRETSAVELNKLIAQMHKLGYYPACILDVHDFTHDGDGGQYRREQVECAIESVCRYESRYDDAVWAELDNMRDWED